MTAAPVSPAPAGPAPLTVAPQPGPQTDFLACGADIAITGGAAGGGKTYGLLLDPLRHCVGPTAVPGFGAVIFRRTVPQITNEGGLWDASANLYPISGAGVRLGRREYVWPDPEEPSRQGPSIRFTHLQHDKTVLDYKSAELPYIGYDQLEDFSAFQFWYMISRLRNTLGIPGTVRGTCNPDPDSFLRDFLRWWIHEETGYAIPERAGQWRWFIRIAGELHWSSDPDALRRAHGVPADDPSRRVKSVAFFPSTIYDNRLLQSKDPGYLGWLESLEPVDRERLLLGNWNIRPTAGKVFHSSWWDVVPAAPAAGRRVRFWDKAASDKPGADWTVGVLMQRTGTQYYVLDVQRGQWTSGQRRVIMRRTALLDRLTYAKRPGGEPAVRIEEEGGSGGLDSKADDLVLLAGYPVSFKRVGRTDGNKYRRAQAYAAQVQGQNVHLVAGAYVPAYIDEHQAFMTQGVPDDQVDAGSGAFNTLAFGEDPELPPTTSSRSLR